MYKWVGKDPPLSPLCPRLSFSILNSSLGAQIRKVQTKIQFSRESGSVIQLFVLDIHTYKHDHTQQDVNIQEVTFVSRCA